MNADFFSLFLCSWQVEPACASQGTWVNQDIEQPFDHRFGVLAVALDAIWISQGQDRQAIGGIPLAKSHERNRFELSDATCLNRSVDRYVGWRP
jgi:hypothetical protein